MYKLYGIPNCDTVKKARTFLESKGVAVDFIDFKKTPPAETDLQRWKDAFGGLPVNSRGVTYKKNKDDYEGLNTSERLSFLKHHTSMIKRPILERDGEVLAFGFDEENYKSVIS